MKKKMPCSAAMKAAAIGGMCAVSYLAVYVAKNAMRAAGPQITQAGAFTTEQLGTMSSAYFISYAIGQLINGSIGDTTMGGKCDFAGQRLVFSVGDFHESQVKPDHTYRADLLDDTGVIFSRPVDPGETAYFAMDADNTRRFYRVEVFDTTEDLRIAVGNPVWITK